MTTTRCLANSSADVRKKRTALLLGVAVGGVLGIFLLTALGCSKDISGHYLSSKGYVRIHQEKGQTLLERWPNRHFAADKKPDVVISLRRDGDQYVGSFMGVGEMAVSKQDNEIFLVGMGKKEAYREIDIDAGDSKLPEEFVVAELSKNIVDALVAKLEKEARGVCGPRTLGKRKRKTLVTALSDAKLAIDKGATKVTEGIIWDRYQATVNMELPAVKTEFPDESVCVETKQEWFTKKCIRWKTQDFVAETRQTVIPVVAQIDVNRFANEGETHSDVRVVGFAGQGGGVWSAHEALCQGLLTSEKHLAFRDKAL